VVYIQNKVGGIIYEKREREREGQFTNTHTPFVLIRHVLHLLMLPCNLEWVDAIMLNGLFVLLILIVHETLIFEE